MSRDFKVRYNPQVFLDIQKQVDYFREETGSDELGNRFVKVMETRLKKLNRSALHYQVRYDDIRLLPITPFAFRAHYRVDEENSIVNVEAIIHTSEDSELWEGRAHE